MTAPYEQLGSLIRLRGVPAVHKCLHGFDALGLDGRGVFGTSTRRKIDEQGAPSGVLDPFGSVRPVIMTGKHTRMTGKHTRMTGKHTRRDENSRFLISAAVLYYIQPLEASV